jgi:hypothetical protein
MRRCMGVCMHACTHADADAGAALREGRAGAPPIRRRGELGLVEALSGDRPRRRLKVSAGASHAPQQIMLCAYSSFSTTTLLPFHFLSCMHACLQFLSFLATIIIYYYSSYYILSPSTKESIPRIRASQIF